MSFKTNYYESIRTSNLFIKKDIHLSESFLHLDRLISKVE
jgi:hypothetical protein